MSDPWFSIEFSKNLIWLAFLSALSLLAVFPLQGRHRRAIKSIWATAIILGGLCLAAFCVALALEQPSHVLAPLFAMGVALTGAFAGTYNAMRHAYREAELRRSVARDI
jgi:CHASE2 domain-containing sensor protein